MAQQIAPQEYEKYWAAKLTAIKKACPDVLRSYLKDQGWKIDDVSPPNSTYKKFKASKRVNIGGQEKIQVIAINKGASGQDLWTDYKNDPTLILVRPPKETFLFVLEAEQRFIKERLNLIKPEHQQMLAPFIDRKVSMETLGADYNAQQPLRNYARIHFGNEYLRMLEFNPAIKNLFISRDPKLDALDKHLYETRQKLIPGAKVHARPKPGGGMYELIHPSLDVYRYKAMELAKLKPSGEMLQWLDRKAMLEKSFTFELIARQYGNYSIVENFYKANDHIRKAAYQKANEVVAGTDSDFKAYKTLLDLAPQAGFSFVRSTFGREYYAKEAIVDGAPSHVVISIPKQEPFKYLDDRTKKGGSISTFIREFMPKEKKQSDNEVKNSVSSIETDLLETARRHGIIIDPERASQQLPNGASLVADIPRQLTIEDNKS